MRLVIAIAIVCVAAVARAQPSMTPPTPEPAPSSLSVAEDRTEIGVHVGAAASAFDTGDYDATGSGPSVDVELGWRHRWLSLIAYGDFTNSSSSSSSGHDATDDIHTRYLGLGGRVRFHFVGAFLGSGIGVESVHQSGPGLRTVDNAVPVFEVDAGYTFPKVGGVQPQLLGVLQGAPYEDATVGIARLSLGVVF